MSCVDTLVVKSIEGLGKAKLWEMYVLEVLSSILTANSL